MTKRGPAFTAEALECLGGNGYVEESGMPRHYREAPLLSIWEGSGNVNALDVLRALGRSPPPRRRSSVNSPWRAGRTPGWTRRRTGFVRGSPRRPRPVPAAWWS